MGLLTVECETGKVSDGFHTFDELYEHRCYLFVALMRTNPEISWRSHSHEDGTMYDGWFVAGMHLPTGDISYHLPINMWKLLNNCAVDTMDISPKFDGHTASDVIKRLGAWCGGN